MSAAESRESPSSSLPVTSAAALMPPPTQVQVIQQPYLQHLYASQQPMLLPAGNLTLHPGLSLQLQTKDGGGVASSTVGKTFHLPSSASHIPASVQGMAYTSSPAGLSTQMVGKAAGQMIHAAASKSTMIQTAGGQPSFVPVTSSPTVVIGQLLPPSSPAPQQQVSKGPDKSKPSFMVSQQQAKSPGLLSGGGPGGQLKSQAAMIHAGQTQLLQALGASLPQGLTWATAPAVLNSPPIFIRSQQSDMFIQSQPMPASTPQPPVTSQPHHIAMPRPPKPVRPASSVATQTSASSSLNSHQLPKTYQAKRMKNQGMATPPGGGPSTPPTANMHTQTSTSPPAPPPEEEPEKVATPQMEEAATSPLQPAQPITEEASPPAKENLPTEPHVKTASSDKPQGPQRAIVKPHVLTHVIEGYIIHEAPEPFPVSRCGPPPPEDPPSHHHSKDKKELAQCEHCGKVGLKAKFKRSKRFCSTSCAKRFAVDSPSPPDVNPSSPQPAAQPDPASPDPLAERPKKKLGFKARKNWRKSKSGRLAYDVPEWQMEVSSSPGEEAAGGETTESSEPSPVTPMEVEPSPEEEENHPPPPTLPNPLKWTVGEVVEFVRQLPGCADLAEEFRQQEIDGQALLLLKEDHLMSAMGLKLGPALKICARISALRDEATRT